MFKETLIIGILIGSIHAAVKPSDFVFSDPFGIFEKQFTHNFAHHYLWPWSQLMKAAAALDDEESLEEPQVTRGSDKFEVKLSVKRFQPEELSIKVKNGYVIVEGQHKETNEQHKHFIANHFAQQFVLPAGCKSEEVTAEMSDKGVLVISAPKHPLPPPEPERIVPIVMLLSEDKTTTVAPIKEETTEKKDDVPSSPSTPIEELELIEATTHQGKIRKKELKTKTTKDNEVIKGEDGNGLDYLIIENVE